MGWLGMIEPPILYTGRIDVGRDALGVGASIEVRVDVRGKRMASGPMRKGASGSSPFPGVVRPRDIVLGR